MIDAREYNRKYYEEHAEKHREYNRKYYAEHAEKQKARVMDWRRRNPDKVREINKRSYEKRKAEKLAEKEQARTDEEAQA